jgi:Zn-dependent peptidase ImmA (M78 family)
MAHELKHHLVDSEAGPLLCGTNDQKARIEIGAEVFAAELIYPEKDFVYDLFRLIRGMPQNVTPRLLVELKRTTQTTLSYAALAKRAVLLCLAEERTLNGARWSALERTSTRGNTRGRDF